MTNLGLHPKLKHTNLVAWSQMIHQIWLARNKTRFNNSIPRIYYIICTILENIKMSSSFSKGQIAQHQIKLDILDRLQNKGRYRRDPKTITVISQKSNWSGQKSTQMDSSETTSLQEEISQGITRGSSQVPISEV